MDALRDTHAGHGLAIGNDGVMLILRRPWLALDIPVTPPISAYVPYGSVGAPRADLLSGLIQHELLEQIIDHFRQALPNDAAAFVIWNEHTSTLALHFPRIVEASTKRNTQ